MKKFFSFFAALLFAGSMMAGSYTITFKDNGEGKGDGSSSMSSTNVADYVAEGAEYFSAVAPTGKVYLGQGGYGLKFGNSSGAGSITLTLVTPVTPTSIVMNASPWSSSEGEGLLQDSIFATKSTGAKGTFADFTYYYNGATQVTTIVVGTNTKRGYVKSITVNYEGGDPVVGNPTYYVAGSMNEWKANANYKLAANPAVDGEFMGEFTFKANDEFKVIMDNGSAEYTWYPAGADNNWKITEDGDYKVYFRPAGNTEWANGYFDVMMKEKPVIPTYNVAEAIAAGLAENTEINVCGIITKMEFKGKNFAQYGSVNIYVADATGAEGVFEFYNCYSLNADTFKTSTPAYDATSTAWAEFTEVADANGNAIHIGDTVIAFGKYKLYNTTHELNTGCNLIEIKHKDAPVVHTYTVAGAPAALFGSEWDPSDANNDMDPVLGGDLYVWRKDSVNLTAGDIEFKVCEDHGWDKAYPAQNYKLNIAEAGYYNILIRFNPKAEPDSMIIAGATKVADAPIVGVETIYNWAKDAADQVGTTILGTTGVEINTVKIHENTDAIPGIKFGSSYVYADGKWIAIKPAEGGFKAGDEISLSVVFNNSDVTKYCMADVYAADGATNLFRSDSASTLNGRNAGEPIVQTYTLASDQDSLLIGRYGNTGMFITLLKVTRALVPPTPENTYTVVGGSAPLFGNTWDPAYEANNMEPITGSEYLYAWKKEGVALTAGTIEYKVCQDHGWATAWPAQGNYNFTIDEAGLYDVTIFFNPELETPTQVVAEFKGAVVVLPNIILHGNFTGSWADTEAFTPASDSLTASLTLALAEGNYEFGFKFDGTWKANGANLTREANTANLSTGEGNMNITADVPGNYLFTYTYATQEVVVTYPEPIIVPDTIDVTMSSLTAPGSLIWDDEVATEGWWQIMGGNDTCAFSLSNGNQITTAAGTYTVADLDAGYSYIAIVKANDTIEVAFVDGSITVAVDEAGVVTIVGALLGNDGNVYNFNLTYVDPKAETTVNVNIAEGKMNDVYANYGLYGVYGTDTTANVFVQLAIWAEDGFQGNFTEEDLDFKYLNSGIVEGLTAPKIYTAAITVTPGNGGDYNITADILCYNNKLYKVTMYIPGAQGIEGVEAATKAIKSLQNGILTIEKAGKTYNVNGTLIR